MLTVVKDALALTENCIQSSHINDEQTLDSFQQLKELTSVKSGDVKLYTELRRLIKRGSSPVSPENILAAFWLSEMHDEQSIKILLDALVSNVHTAQFAAAWGLRRLKASESIRNQLVTFYKKHRGQDFIGQLLGVIILLSDDQSGEWIKQELQSGLDELTLRTICRVLSNGTANKDFVVALLKGIASRNPFSVRMAAGCSLALLNDSAGVDILLEALQFSNSPDDLKWTLLYAKNLSIYQGYQSIKDLLHHPNVDIKIDAIDALGFYGLPDAIDLLLDSISGQNEDSDQAALSALDWITSLKNVVSYDEIEENYQKRDWLEDQIRAACPNMQASLRYWHGKPINPSIVFDDLGTPELGVPEVAFSLLRFSYGFMFLYEPYIPWVFNRDTLQRLEEMIRQNSERFSDGIYYMFGHPTTSDSDKIS